MTNDRSIDFSQQLLAWFDVKGRKHLPWQQDRSAYRVWLSEIMLQQTQVATVISYFERFITRFPRIQDLANAKSDEVMKLWAGLGYYARARNLHACAKIIAQQYNGSFPASVELLEQLPGIGRSTAGAIISQAYNKRAVILDGNVKRVLARYRMVSGWTGKTAVQKILWALADSLTPDQRSADYTQAIMDLGATVCRRANPLCNQCPVNQDCQARLQGVVDQYPEKKVRKPLPTKEVYLLLCYTAEKPQSILLEKRPPSGIWGGLWSLPQCEPVQVPGQVVTAQYGYTVEAVEEIDAVEHSFTHFHLYIRPLMVRVGSMPIAVSETSGQWFDACQIAACGMPRPVEKLVEHFFARIT